MELQDRVALVTGGDRGIGRAIAVALARAGADVALSYRSRVAEAESAAGAIRSAGRRALVVQADMASESDVKRMIAGTETVLGRIDILVANAGIGPAVELEAIDAATFDLTIAVNLRAAFLATQAVLPGMRQRRHGRLLYVSSTAAQVGGIIGPHYAASKAGLIGLAHGYAARLAGEGITANVIAPALVATEMIGTNPRARPERIPVGRFGEPDEVAAIAVALAANAYVTGQTVQVNGGLYFTS